MTATKSRIGAALDELIAERQHLAARMEKIDDLIATMREVFHLPSGDTHRARPARAAPRPSGNGRRAAISAAAVQAALADGPLGPGELATALNIDRGRLRYHLLKFERDGLVVSTGSTANRRVALAGKAAPAKEVP